MKIAKIEVMRLTVPPEITQRFAEAARAATCSAGMSCVRLPSVLMHARSCISIVFLFRRRLERYASRVAGPANCERRTGSSLSATSTGL